MNKEKMYHVGIKNLENKRKENFILATDRENPQRITGADNLAPKYQVGRMEYGDFTNHSVWAQSDWSEGGGKKYFEAYQDGYNVYPFTKKYYSKVSMQTTEYPGELRLGASANLMESFPEKEGEVVKIIGYDNNIYVAVNLSDRAKIYRTSDSGKNWILHYDSFEDYHNEIGYTPYQKIPQNIKIKNIFISYTDSADKKYNKRANPSNGQVIPDSEWDQWWEDRRYGGLSIRYLFIHTEDINGFSYFLKTGTSDGIDLIMDRKGTVKINTNNEYIINEIYNDRETEYDAILSGLSYTDSSNNQQKKDIVLTVSSEVAARFFIGQRLIITKEGGQTDFDEIVATNTNELILKDGMVWANPSNDLAVKIKLSTTSPIAAVLNKATPTIMGTPLDFQGLHVRQNAAYDISIVNQRNKKGSFIISAGNSNGPNNPNVVRKTFDSHRSDYYRKLIDVSSDEFDYIYAYNDNQFFTKRVNYDKRNYILIYYDQSYSSSSDFKKDDILKFDKIYSLKSNNPVDIVGAYTNKDTLNRDNVIYFVAYDNVEIIKNPNDALKNFNYSTINWATLTNKPTTTFLDEIKRELYIATKDEGSGQSSVHLIDDDTSGAAPSILTIGEKEISSMLKHNENLYISTNDKGKIYRYDGNTYEVIESLDLDPSTSSANISDSAILKNKILFANNVSGEIVSYDTESDIWDIYTSPRYEKEEGDLIASILSFQNTLYMGTNKKDNLVWTFNDEEIKGSGELISSWYSADMPAVDKKGLYAQILTQKFKNSKARIRLSVQIDYDDKWYYLSKERGQVMTLEPNELHELTYSDYKASRAFYLYFPYDFPKFKTIRYRVEMFSGEYKTEIGSIKTERPIINNIDVFYILTDPKEVIFTYNFMLENRMQIGSYGDNEIGTHRDKLDFLLDIWNNDTMVEITHVDGKKYTCIPFKPMHLQGGGMSVIYQNISPSRKDLDQLSYLVTMMFKNINKIDNFGK